ncbi:MAG: hypothetical protein AAGG53_17675 [Cyanobacteria bacterium P01_H01_bin.152]
MGEAEAIALTKSSFALECVGKLLWQVAGTDERRVTVRLYDDA